ncbi:MAG: isochorismatase family cysteine hydrolase [Eubacteriales bacterium]|nr:isochorismatase family cysteine hydrolase [Eubacteriales bacterium]
MKKKFLIVVDMQKDFVTGSLGTREAQAIVPAVVRKVQEFDGSVLFTKDTHEENYLASQEGRLLPVPHCIRGTDGWQLLPELDAFCAEHGCRVYEKPTFGCTALAHDLCAVNAAEGIESIELIGLCTDICVVSNALLLKAAMPEVPILVDESCLAGVTPEKHDAALETMRSCQITVCSARSEE